MVEGSQPKKTPRPLGLAINTDDDLTAEKGLATNPEADGDSAST